MKQYIYLIALLLGGGVLLLNSSVGAAETLPFKIIVNASNPHESMTEKNLSKLFLKKIKKWPKFKLKVLPVDYQEESPIRQYFSKIILGRDVAFIKTYWEKQIFSGRAKPPQQFSSDPDMMEYVAQSPGAIGYVSAETEITNNNLKVIKVKLKKGKRSDISW